MQMLAFLIPTYMNQGGQVIQSPSPTPGILFQESPGTSFYDAMQEEDFTIIEIILGSILESLVLDGQLTEEFIDDLVFHLFTAPGEEKDSYVICVPSYVSENNIAQLAEALQNIPIPDEKWMNISADVYDDIVDSFITLETYMEEQKTENNPFVPDMPNKKEEEYVYLIPHLSDLFRLKPIDGCLFKNSGHYYISSKTDLSEFFEVVKNPPKTREVITKDIKQMLE